MKEIMAVGNTVLAEEAMENVQSLILFKKQGQKEGRLHVDYRKQRLKAAKLLRPRN